MNLINYNLIGCDSMDKKEQIQADKIKERQSYRNFVKKAREMLLKNQEKNK